MDADAPDETLMQAYAQGRNQAFDLLYRRHRASLYRFLLRNLRHRDACDELFQDVWQRVIAARGEYRPEARFSAWLYRIAHNRLHDHWRARGLRPEPPEDSAARIEAIPAPDTPERAVEAFAQGRRLQQALDELPPEQRETLLLRLEQALSLEAIGEITGVGRETVKSRLRYATATLRKRLAP